MWTAALLALKGFGTWLIGPVGRYVLLAAIGLFALWWTVDWIGDRREKQCEDRHAAALAQANAKARRLEDVRDELARQVVAATRAKADKVSTEIQGTTAAAVVKVRTIYTRIPVPAECAKPLPPEIDAEGRAAVQRANKDR